MVKQQMARQLQRNQGFSRLNSLPLQFASYMGRPIHEPPEGSASILRIYPLEWFYE